MTSQRSIVILGSTGSIGTQAIDVVRRNRDRFAVRALAAGGGAPQLLAQQALDLGVETVGVARATTAEDVILHLKAEASRRGLPSIPKVLAGPTVAAELAAGPCDVVLNAVSGSVGLAATVACLRAGHTLALANKESLVAGGTWVRDMARPGQIVPVDSEHSAMAQCLRAGRRDEVARFILTASGGPFRGRSRAELTEVTLAEAMAHPTWAMGTSVTLNSANLVNKGLELIEAHLLFDVPPEDIEVVVHPQSTIHSMIEYADGSTIAQASPPDMRMPIALALGWPHRVPGAQPTFDWSTAQSWTFEPLDDDAFPAVRLARRCASIGGLAPAAYNAANEQAQAAFIGGRIGYLDVVDVIGATLDRLAGDRDLAAPGRSLESIVAFESAARTAADTLIAARTKDGSTAS
ncbi:1-deoxy-D-xylulose-5-phosphate reductoisomerase [Cumulibacter manganitolerans]|uniref:1-deoxy-D-xylulose-5-phosphate reductoisomerase n=1 Tax=Cumulibacter manganitolerans TaxID=1884992 RepID=UPI0012960771|nr:1-deoxy-D-xylulose-5-phosphate reductoisomerase [Cumulibacter manganitolerans]